MEKKRYGKKEDQALDAWVKLARAYSMVQKKSREDIERTSLTAAQFAVLECLYHKGPQLLGELTRRMLVSAGNTTVVVANLEKEGYVERQQDPKDRRKTTVRISQRGRMLLDKIFPAHARWMSQMFSTLSEQEQKQLSALLKKLGMSIQERFDPHFQGKSEEEK